MMERRGGGIIGELLAFAAADRDHRSAFAARYVCSAVGWGSCGSGDGGTAVGA
jgi:hypothetical protein